MDPPQVTKLFIHGAHARDEAGEQYVNQDLDPWSIILLLRFLDSAMPVQFFKMTGDSETVFTMQDVPQWDSETIKTLLKLKMGDRTMLALVFINPFTAEAGVYGVTVGDCAGTVELVNP